MKVWWNGRLVDEADVRISPFDRGLLLGDAVFETLRTYGGRPFGLDAHLERLRASCETTRIPFPPGLREAVAAVLEANGADEAMLRITLTRGPGGRGASPRGAGPPTVLVTAAPIPHAPEVYARGIRLRTSSRRRIPPTTLPAGIKSTNYLAHVLARIEAEEAGADDALFVDDEGSVVEATQANLFALFGDARSGSEGDDGPQFVGELVTPPLASGCLPGHTRAQVLALARELGLDPVERPISAATLRDAREVMLTASVLEVASVVELDGAPIGGGRPGEVADRLHAAYRKRARADRT